MNECPSSATLVQVDAPASSACARSLLSRAVVSVAAPSPPPPHPANARHASAWPTANAAGFNANFMTSDLSCSLFKPLLPPFCRERSVPWQLIRRTSPQGRITMTPHVAMRSHSCETADIAVVLGALRTREMKCRVAPLPCPSERGAHVCRREPPRADGRGACSARLVTQRRVSQRAAPFETSTPLSAKESTPARAPSLRSRMRCCRQGACPACRRRGRGSR